MPKIRGIDYQELVDAMNQVGINTDTNEVVLTVAPLADFTATGTTSANAATSITGVSTVFLSQLGIGDRISLSSAPGTFATVTTISSNTALIVNAALGNGTSQTILVKKALMRIDTSGVSGASVFSDQGQWGINVLAPAAKLNIAETDGTTPEYQFQIDRASGVSGTAPVAASVRLNASRGTTNIKSALQNTDPIGSYDFGGFNGSVIGEGARISVFADGNWTNSSQPSYLTMSTTATNGTTANERIRLDSSGNFGIGITPTSKFHLSDGINRNPSLVAGAQSAWNLNNAGGELCGGLYTTSPFNYWIQAKASGASKDLILQPLGGGVAIGVNPLASGVTLQIVNTAVAPVIFRMDGNSNDSSIDCSQIISNNISFGIMSRIRTINHSTTDGQLILETRKSGAAGSEVYNTFQLYLDGAGNVGVSAAVPSEKLHVSGNLALGTQAGSGNGTALKFIPSNAATNWMIGSNVNVGSVLEFTPSTAGGGSTFTTPVFKLDSSNATFTGRINSTYSSSPGGGFTAVPATTSGAATFEASNLNNVSYYGNESSVGGTTFTGSTAYATILGNNSAIPLQFFTNNALRASIDSSGRMGIGTTAASTLTKKLVVRDASSASTTVGNSEVIRVCGGGSTSNQLTEIGLTYGAGFGDSFSPIIIGYQYTSGSGFTNGDIYFATRSVTTDTAPTERVRIDSAGSLLVGFANSPDTIHKIWNTSTTNPTLDVRNINTSTSSDSTQALTITKGSTTNTAGTNNFIVFQINNGGTTSGKISTNGASAAAFFSASDLRLKKDIVPMTGALDLIGKLNPVNFAWKANDQRRNGFIAQELVELMPELVSKTDDGVGESLPEGQEPWTMTDSGMIPYLVKAIQELKAQIERLSTVCNQNCKGD